MINPAEKLEACQPSLMYGQVTAPDDLGYEVLTDFGPINAVKAAGCLIEPGPGDLVLLSVDVQNVAFILSVLIRESGESLKTSINLPGPVEVWVQGGDLSFSSDNNINLTANRDLDLTSGRLSLQAEEGRVTVERASILGRSLDIQIQFLKTAAKTVEHIFESFIQKFKNTWRYVAEHEEVQSKTTRRLTEDALTVQAGNEYHLVEDTVKIDAGQIHLG